MSKRAAIYARVSTSEQKKNNSLPTQIAACQRFAAEHGYEVVGVYEDDYTGASIDRPGLDDLRDGLRQGGITTVVALQIDRTARELVYQLLIEKEFEKLGVEIEYVNGQFDKTPQGQFQRQVMGAVAELEKELILERFRRGKLGKAKGGRVVIAGYAPYGYRKVGEKRDVRLELDEDEARVVRLIFDWYVYGDESGALLPANAIARRLDEMGVRTRAKGEVARRFYEAWSPSTITSMLANELYIGTWYYNKTVRVQRGDKSIMAPRPREEWVAVSVPAIIDQATFDLARERAQRNREQAKRNRKYSYLFSGCLRCGTCGRYYWGAKLRNGTLYYRCQGGRRQPMPKCGAPSFFEDELERTLWTWVSELITQPERVLQTLKERQAALESENAPIIERLALVDQQLADQDRQLKRLLDTYVRNPDLPQEWLDEQKGRLTKMRSDLEREHTRLSGQLQDRQYSSEQVDNIFAFCATLAGKAQKATPEAKRFAFEMLELTARLAIEDGQKVVHASCILGAQPLRVGNSSSTCSAGRPSR